MGIKGLNAFLRAKTPNAFVELPNSYFRGKRIAIDSDNILRRLMSRAHKEIVNRTDVTVREPDRDEIIKRWFYHTKNFIADWLRVGATPIFVFDGKYIPSKAKTQQKRRADRQKTADAAEDYKIKVMELDELERTQDMLIELRKKMQNLSSLSKDEKEMMMCILSAIGIPVLVAEGEGEKLCAMLCIEGRVDAVYSRDTDLVAFGCPLTINEPSGFMYNPDTKEAEDSHKCTLFKPVLSGLNLEYETFVELCIMAGCDFNDNIPHLSVSKAYDLLVKCNSIDNLPQKYHKRATCNNSRHGTCQRVKEAFEDQVDCLNHEECRDIFSHKPSESICQDEIVLDIDTDLTDSRDILEMYMAEDWLTDIVPLYRNIIRPGNNVVPKPPSLSSSRLKLNVIATPGVPKPRSPPKLKITQPKPKPAAKKGPSLKIIPRNKSEPVKVGPAPPRHVNMCNIIPVIGDNPVQNSPVGVNIANVTGGNSVVIQSSYIGGSVNTSQKSSPKRISQIRTEGLSKGQHDKLKDRYPHLFQN